MRDAITGRDNKRRWLPLAAVTVALVGGLTTQLPSASADPNRVRALTDSAPSVVDPSPQVGPDSGVDVPAGPTAPVDVTTPSDAAPTAPTTEPTKPAVPVAKPAKAPARTSAPKAPRPRRVPSPK